MDFATKPKTWAAGVRYWLKREEAHELIAELAAALEPRQSEILARLNELPSVRIEPMSVGEYQEARSRSTLLGADFQVTSKKAGMVRSTDFLAKERAFARAILRKRISDPRNLTINGEEVDGPTLIDSLWNSISPEAQEVLDELSAALHDASVLEAGLGERSAWRRVG